MAQKIRHHHQQNEISEIKVKHGDILRKQLSEVEQRQSLIKEKFHGLIRNREIL